MSFASVERALACAGRPEWRPGPDASYNVLAMNARLLGRLISLSCWLLCSAPAVAQPAASPTPSRVGNRHALLIGCTAYPELGRRYQLRGPSNDVALTRQLLHDRFGFADDRIVALVHENELSLRPTYDNIVREFEALISRVASGDDVFVMLGGHGSQLKDDNPHDASDDEPDGLDEVFLPEDVTRWTVNNPDVKAIRDDQIGAWLDAIRDRGAFVFFVADTCHAGTIDRSAGDLLFDEHAFYRERHVDPEVLNAPEDLANRGEAATGEAVNALIEPAESRGGLVALYAVDSRTLEREHPMPPENQLDGPAYGRLSFALNWVLARSKRQLTYQQLAQQIRWRYDGWQWSDLGFMLGAPQDLQRFVLGEGSWVDRSTVTLSRDEFGRLAIDVGLLHGATVGSVYRVYPILGSENEGAAVGCVKVTEATPTSARVEPCQYDHESLVAADLLPAPARCELAYAAVEALKMTIGIVPRDPSDSGANCDAFEQVIGNLAAERGAIFRLAAAGEAPDAFVVVRGDEASLRRTWAPAEAADDDHPRQFPAAAFGPFRAEAGASAPIALALRAMAKAINLRSIATSDNEVVIGDPEDPAVTLDVVVERWNPTTEVYDRIDAARPLDVHDGDKLRVSVANQGDRPVDVTILYIESAFRIRSYFPTERQVLQGAANTRIVRGERPAIANFTINDETTGLEDVLIIATLPRPGSPPQNFVFLEQPGLTSDRGDDDARSALKTPAGQLLATLGFGRGDRGGASTPDLATFAVHRLSWTVRGRDPAVP